MSFVFVLSCDDWLMIWLGLEINMISFVCLVFWQKDMWKSEVCLKYFFVQSLGSAIFMSFFYLESNWVSTMGVLVLGYKMGAAPFFYWFPSMCEGLSWMSCFLLMSFQKIIPLYLMSSLICFALWLMMMLSLVVGAMGSFNQSSLKRLLAFSSIHHIGWMIMGMMVKSGLWILYLLMYMFMIFVVVSMFEKEDIQNVSSLFSVKVGWGFVLNMLSMGGVPPLLGFFMKWMVFYYVGFKGMLVFLLMIITSVIMFYVYLRVLYDMIMGGSMLMCWEIKNELGGVYANFLEVFSIMGVFVFPLMFFTLM